MKLYLMRHGPAEDQSSTGRDADRELSPHGKDRVKRVAHALLHQKENPKSIISSPLARAVQTARIVAHETGLPGFKTRRELGMASPAVELVRELADHHQEGALLVGHQPDISKLVAKLTGQSSLPEGIEGVSKAMVLALDLPRKGHAQLLWVLEPKSLTFHTFP